MSDQEIDRDTKVRIGPWRILDWTQIFSLEVTFLISKIQTVESEMLMSEKNYVIANGRALPEMFYEEAKRDAAKVYITRYYGPKEARKLCRAFIN